ncbi:MAG: cation diffusion facilitator family transporter [Candidatus Bathyarchaeota archaeon]|nr:cation diffusion facilitator family transporter [Candidatus Bathyarchaeota archaeon]
MPNHSHDPNTDKISNIHEYKNVTKTRLLLSMTITAAVMVIEVFGSILTGSLALASDAGHMFTHLFALAISFTAIIIACKQPCHHRTYGYYRAEILAALANSIFLFAVTAYIFYQGIERLLHPQPVLGFEMFLVALAGLAANGISILLLHNSTKNDLNIKGAFLHMFADMASSIAIIIGAVIVSVTGWYIIDPLLGIGISMLIFVWAFGLMRDSVNVLMETAPKGMNINVVTAEIKANFPQVVAITDMHLWEITSGMYSLTAQIEANITSTADVTVLIEKINRLLIDKFGIKHTTLQVEPKS